jgi:hypothetical protein
LDPRQTGESADALTLPPKVDNISILNLNA